MASGNGGAALAALQNRTVQISIGIGLLVIIIAVCILFFVNAGKNLGTYRSLASGLDQSRALEIAAQLKSKGLDVNIAEKETGGSSVEVREKQYDSAVLELAKSDLLITDDFKLFDKTDWAASDYEKRVKYMRAIGGEISRLVSRMEGIRWAKVHVTIPPEKVFASRYEKTKTSASVTVELEPAFVMSNNQVASILSLVSGYVPELEPSRISIIDTKGRIYSSATNIDHNSSNIMASTDSVAINSDIESRIQSYLDGIVGIGKSRVAISTQIINEKVTSNKTIFFSGAVGTEEYSEEALGDSANLPPYTGNNNLPAPQPRPIVQNNYHQSNNTEMVDSRLKKDMPPNIAYSNNNQNYNANPNYSNSNTSPNFNHIQNALPPPEGSKYVCAANDEACKRNYRRHNFSVQNYPSYEQITTESPAGRISQIKASIVVERGSLPISVGELKQGIAAAGHPSMGADDVQIVFGNPPPVKEEAQPKNKLGFLNNLQGKDNKGLPWFAWLIIGFIGFMFIIWLLGRIGSLFAPKPKATNIRDPFNTPTSPNPIDPFNMPRREPVPPPQPAPRKNTPIDDFEESANFEENTNKNDNDDLPFDLDDDFANEIPAPTSAPKPQVEMREPERKKPKIVIEDD